jgi:rhodanese-related sulfurtransferase
MPLAELEHWLPDIPQDTTLVFTCNPGRRSSQAAQLAEHIGFKTATFCPLKDWKDTGYETTGEKKSS